MELIDEALNPVNSDKASDTGNKPGYAYNIWVEMYNTPLHVTTCRMKLLGAFRDLSKGHEYWEYFACVKDVGERSRKVTINADDIQC